MDKHLEELKNTVKAMDAEERKAVLSCIPAGEILEHLQSEYKKIQDKIAKVEAVVNDK